MVKSPTTSEDGLAGGPQQHLQRSTRGRPEVAMVAHWVAMPGPTCRMRWHAQHRPAMALRDPCSGTGAPSGQHDWNGRGELSWNCQIGAQVAKSGAVLVRDDFPQVWCAMSLPAPFLDELRTPDVRMLCAG